MSTDAPLLLDDKPANEVAHSISPGAFQPGESKVVQVDGASMRLDHLGPMVINLDGTVARISNWDAMSEAERLNTLRVLGRRNRGRVEELAKAQGFGDGIVDADPQAQACILSLCVDLFYVCVLDG
ncbi:hypothetical protein FIBSPDRAFT_873483 [Athelia psychrophila]|uniref:Uncharacterized protein n=2 Tax=Athelia psychrophila TaxID=1759441 RepID=A0A165YH52_9AGAM|nr:hypothetical protein FIBSPDRAFT_873483 [Fibularhizoctonia sp. CBS 109695]